jgi:hypothetical protein
MNMVFEYWQFVAPPHGFWTAIIKSTNAVHSLGWGAG